MEKVLQNLSAKKLFKNQILLRVIKENIDIFKKILTSTFNEAITFLQFSSTTTLADIIPIFNKDNQNLKSNLCFLSNIFLKRQYGIKKGFSTQDCLLVMIETWKKGVDTKGTFGVLLTDFSKDFDCISEQLLIARVSDYTFLFKAFEFIYSSINSRKQRVRINKSFSKLAVPFQVLFNENICKANFKFYYQLYHFTLLHFQRRITI